MASALPKPWIVDEFRSWDREQEERYELVDGVVRMMTGGSNAHAAVKGHLFAALRTSVREPCRVFVDGPKVVTTNASLYRDVVATCAPVVMADDTVREPVLIAEILSRTTAGHDRGRIGLPTATSRAWRIICWLGSTCGGSSCFRGVPTAGSS